MNVNYQEKKYRILEILQTKFPVDKSRQLRKEFPKILNVNQRTFLNWIYMNQDNPSEISYRYLYIIAKVLNETVENLLNFEITYKEIKADKKN